MTLGEGLIFAGALLLVFSILRSTSLRRRKQRLEEEEARARKKH
jgi:hypothetical protein